MCIKAYPVWVTLEIDNVYILFVYPSQLQESVWCPPLPDAHTNIEPLPFLPCRQTNNQVTSNKLIIKYNSV